MTKNPIRVQRKRTKGWRMPENTLYVGRGTRWGNRFNKTQCAVTFSHKGLPSPIVYLRTDVVARDTMIQVGVPFSKADRLARIHSGTPRARLEACMEHF